MRNLIFYAILLIIAEQNAQNSKIRVEFLAYPISTIDTPPSSNPIFEGHSESVALAQSYKYKYSLYIDVKKGISVYKIDTIYRENVPKGKENVRFMINNELPYVIKKKDTLYKKETIFKNTIYSKGLNGDIEWTITNEKKVINGFNCTKATSKEEDFMFTAWFTNEIPVSSGPAYFFGLPGLIVWVEEFSWTTEINKIEYLNDSFDIEKLYNEIKIDFDTSKKDKFMDDRKLLYKKADLYKSILKGMGW
jgi:GLPGLI family protein